MDVNVLRLRKIGFARHRRDAADKMSCHESGPRIYVRLYPPTCNAFYFFNLHHLSPLTQLRISREPAATANKKTQSEHAEFRPSAHQGKGVIGLRNREWRF